MRKYGKIRWGIIGVITILLVGVLTGIWFSCYQRGQGMRLVKQMGVGINIGNSLDVTRVRQYLPDATVEEFETFWNNPPITRALLQAIHDKGFNTVRIPVSWDEHLLQDGTVDPDWMQRVEQVVDWALDCDLYVILNIHHESWLIPTPEEEKRVTEQLCNLWEQIASRFANRDDKLLFESMNEPRLVGSEEEWTAGTSEMRDVVNRLNAAFVSTVRATGGKNDKRWLLLPAYATQSSEEALEDLILPDDANLMVAIHAYLPYEFTLGGTTAEWSAKNSNDVEKIDQLMERLERLFLCRDIPVVITEFGCDDQNNLEARLEWAQYYMRSATKAGVGCIWWDNGKDSSLIDRETCEWTQSELAELLVKEAF